MNRNKTLGVFFVLGLFVCLVRADGPVQVLVPIADAQDAGKDQQKQPDKDKKTPQDKDKKKPETKDKITPEKGLTEQPKTDIFDQALLPRGETATAFNPHMMGDQGAIFARETITLFGTLTTTTSVTTFKQVGTTGVRVPVTTTTTTITPTSQTRTLLVPIATAGAFKVAENASPRPQDRVFMTYNYFDDLQGPGGAPIPAVNNTQSTTISGTPSAAGAPAPMTTTAATTSIAGQPRLTADLNREVFGFEKTFLDGYASIEVRMPVLQLNSPLNGFGSNDIGDLTIIGKYAFILDRDSGNVLSAGLAVTAPTGPRIPTIDGNLNSTYVQPWFGYIWNADRFFIQAFHSVVIPTDSRDVTLLFNDIGLNYWLYRNNDSRFLSFIVPMAEVHVTTPLDHRDANGAIYVPDIVDLTGGVHFGLFRNTTLSLGVATPVTGPRVFSVEGFMQLNWRF
jgi:hypothetical protein